MTFNYKVVDVPSMLSREVAIQDQSNPATWIRDDAWYNNVKEIYTNLLHFFVSNSLLEDDIACSDIDSLVLKFSDFNQLGQKFINTGADERWLSSFDRPGSKKAFSDVRYLEKALRQIVGSIH